MSNCDFHRDYCACGDQISEHNFEVHPPKCGGLHGECRCAGLMGVRLGIYRHYKGGLYRLLSLGRNSESLQIEAHYMSLDDGGHWHRPLEGRSGFLSKVQRPDGEVARFEFLVPTTHP